MLGVLEKAASDPTKKELLNNETQVGRFRRACLSVVPAEYEHNGEMLSYEGVGLKLLSIPAQDLTKVQIKRAMAEGGVAESELYPVYVAWAKSDGIKQLSKPRFIESFRELEKARRRVFESDAKVRVGKAEKRLRDSYPGLWWAGEHSPFIHLFPTEIGGDRLYSCASDQIGQINIEMLNVI